MGSSGGWPCHRIPPVAAPSFTSIQLQTYGLYFGVTGSKTLWCDSLASLVASCTHKWFPPGAGLRLSAFPVAGSRPQFLQLPVPSPISPFDSVSVFHTSHLDHSSYLPARPASCSSAGFTHALTQSTLTQENIGDGFNKKTQQTVMITCRAYPVKGANPASCSYTAFFGSSPKHPVIN